MLSLKQGSEFYRPYDLAAARREGAAENPAPHQAEALQKLHAWYKSPQAHLRGGVLVLPTGGGKTLTAVHFSGRSPLSDGFKVLWLTHTHHLLEQAFFSMANLVGLIAEPRQKLNMRVVSGTIGHFPVHSIRTTDDVIIGSLQAACNAVINSHKQLEEFLDSARGKLFVVFDEAHHSPAPSYRNLILSLRARCPEMHLLGLTATPTHGEERKRGWLLKLFPQGIIYQVEPRRLMASGVLSRPVFEEANSSFEPDFDERGYQKWVDTHRDLPEEIITTLANTQERNDYIVGFYLNHREKYGKTLIFADRWFQCDYLREKLRNRGVRADVVYSHVDADPGGAEARNRRTAGENAQVLQRFREGLLDVLINVRMLTEGTDVPDVQSVFLTRQTTSQILLTQMVGRALRGPRFGGTDRAYIVSFIDNWKHRINWAAYDQLAPGLADESIPEYGKRPPLQLISIDLVRRLARQMDSGINVNPAPYRTFLPIGWYRVEYYARVEGSDDIEPVGQLVMVFEDEQICFERFIEVLKTTNLEVYQSDDVRLDAVHDQLSGWRQRFFANAAERVGGRLIEDLFAIARHMAQNEQQPPKFFPFEAREQHDLDAIAQEFYSQDLGPRKMDDSLRGEYARQDRLWRVFYYTYGLFKSHYDACINRLLGAHRHGTDPKDHEPVFDTPELIPEGEPSDELKAQVKSRDDYRCLCCDNANRRQLQVDHIYPSYYGGINHLNNLQTLCRICNQVKGKETIDFRINQTPLTASLPRFPEIETPSGIWARKTEQWEMFIRHAVNLFYRCAAVQSVEIGRRGNRFRHWEIRLFKGNNERWLDPYLKSLTERIRTARQEAYCEAAPDRITVTS
jgi:superfamily II DNA or RNA helicase